ncbi:hypothetical protein O999_14655 [Pseudomonas putida LF54]|nr:hypothetical protein O999_14655 [Pseudomonas putida LF54]
MDDYLRHLAADRTVINGYDHERINRYNVAPSTRVELIRQTSDGLRVDRVKWGWAPFWAKGKRPDPINARAETVMTGKFFKALWPVGRALAPANGWFEWIPDPADPKRKQPYYITAANNEPLFFAALAEVHGGLEPDDRDGFVIITAAADEGMGSTVNSLTLPANNLASARKVAAHLEAIANGKLDTADMPHFEPVLADVA